MNKSFQEVKSAFCEIYKRDVLWSMYILTICGGFLFLSLLGIHGSSLNLLVNDNSSILVGNDRPIRSDEFLRSTPFELNRILFPESSGVSQVSESSLNEPGVGFYELLRPERFLLSIFLSGSQLFAALWWMPHLLLFLGVPLFLRSIKLQTKLAIPFGIIIAFSPSVVWWSNSIAGIVGRVAFASGLILLSVQKRRTTKFILGFSGTYLISGSFVDYAPWVIVVAIFFTVFGLLEFFSKEKKPLPTVFGIILGLVPLSLFIIKKSSIFSTLAQTTYPGSRRYDGGVVNVSNWAFSAPQQWALLKPESILASNQSELSLGFLIFILPSIYLIIRSIQSKTTFIKVIIFAQTYLFLIAWTFVPIPQVGINPLELVSPERALTVTSTLAPLFFAIILGWVRQESSNMKPSKLVSRHNQKTTAVTLVCTLAFYITFSSGLTIRNSVSPFPLLISGLVALFVAFAIGMVIAGKTYLLYGIWLFAFLSFLIGVAVNPVAKGFENVYGSELSRALKSNDSSATWGSNSMFIDAMLTLNGKDQISGQQLNGPKIQQWKILDPFNQYREVWNSGASYLQLSFDESSSPPIISRVGGDQIMITLNPCSRYAKELDLGYVVSVVELSNSCLIKVPVKHPIYLGNVFYIYKTTP
jgi:hypothetical protein